MRQIFAVLTALMLLCALTAAEGRRTSAPLICPSLSRRKPYPKAERPPRRTRVTGRR